MDLPLSPVKRPSSSAASAASATSKTSSPTKRPGSSASRKGSKGSKSPSKYKAPRNKNTASEPEGWQSWPELSVRIDSVPSDVTTTDLFRWFSPEGDIVWLDTFGLKNDFSSMSARICFEPPPKRAFWDRGLFRVDHPGHPDGIKLILTVSKDAPQGWMNSPAFPGRKYPMRIKLKLQHLGFGSMVGPKDMATMKTFKNSGGLGLDGLRIELDVKYRKLTVFFPIISTVGQQKFARRFKFVADTSVIKTIYQSPDGESRNLVIPLPYPPQYYWKKDDLMSTVMADQNTWSIKDAWHRATDVFENVDVQMRHPVGVRHDIADLGFIDIGRWTTFHLSFDTKSEQSKEVNRQLHMALEDCNVNIDVCDDFKVAAAGTETMWTHLDHPPIVAQGALALLNSNPVIHLPFEVRYQLEVCVSRGVLNDLTISAEFLHKLAALDPTKARLRLEYLADQEEPVYDPLSLFSSPEAEAYFPNFKIPYYCALARKAKITPTRILYSSPAVETSNRVIRKYSHIQDRFLRVQFLEEHESGRIGSSTRPGDDEIWKRVLRTLYSGIKIGDRRYEFLAFGSSQLKLSGAYFFCPTEHVSCDSIRNWMGQFDHIKIIAKYSARLGQCLSTTREIRGIHIPNIKALPDVERNGYCFTDGVGKISEFLAKLVIEEMTLDIFDEPGAFQFRMGGCKGVLAVWPEAKGMDVYVRESQEKFKADYNGLEIIRCAKFASATLNRQTIPILECLGVPVRAFENLLDQQLRSYQRALTDNSVALDLLTRFVDDNQTTLILAEFLKAGFKTSEGIQEPFVMNVLNLWRSWSLKLLKEKARIQVEKSAFVLGCVDETRTLRGHSVLTEGSMDKDKNKLPQIFLQTTDPKHYGKTNIVKGVCIVGRNPSLHPGDIRVVQAVDCPKLHHLKDVVVFPATGDRPVPNMLSGGDLDGDDFFVIWEPSLIPTEWNHPPMNYAGPKPVNLDRDVNVDDLRNFFVNYMKNDVLGLIATAHLGVADEQGPKSQLCLKLADLHSKAVDYPKTGEPAEWSAKFQPRKWPHFMEKKPKSSYHSNKALGVIFDKVARQSFQFLPDWEHAFDQRILTRFHLSDELLRAARGVKSQYDTAVRRVLAQQDLSTEFELWTSFAMSRPAVGSDYKRQEDLGSEYDALKQRFRDICYEAAGGNTAEKLDPFVAAMYKVTEEEIKIALHEHHRDGAEDAEDAAWLPHLDPKSMPLISFPWIFHWVMIRVALGDSYNPKSLRMAVARRKGDVVPQTPPANSGKGGQGLAKQAEEVSTKLPDGKLVHRGQPLTLFHGDEYDTYEAAEKQESESESESEARPAEGAGVGREAEIASEGEAENDCVMDRLARLVDFGDE